MSYSISVSHFAQIQIIRSADWYFEQQAGLEKRFLKNVDSALDQIRRGPLKSQVRYKHIRIKFLEDFNHGIHYIVEDKSIFVLAVYHTSQDSVDS